MMRALLNLGIGLASLPLLSACVAAALPVLAAGTVMRTQTDNDNPAGNDRIIVDQSAPQGQREPILARTTALIPQPVSPAGNIPSAPAGQPATYPAITDRGLALFVDHVLSRARLVNEGAPVTSLVLANGLLAREPEYVQCRQARPAVIVDLDRDEAAGGESGSPGTNADDQVAAHPGMIAALAAVRAAGVDILWITDDRTRGAAAISAHLQSSGLDPAGLDRVLVPDGVNDRKQLRRLRAAATHCIVAVAGDRRSDADEVYDYLRDPTIPLAIDANWDAGWFILPPPFDAAPIPQRDE